MNLVVETDGTALKFSYLFIFSRRSQEHFVEQLYHMPAVGFSWSFSDFCSVLGCIYHERAQAALPPQYRGLDFAALNAFHSSCFIQGTTDGQTGMQSR